MNVKSQSELDNGGRETCIYLIPFYILVRKGVSPT